MANLGSNLNEELLLTVPGLNPQLQSFVPTFKELSVKTKGPNIFLKIGSATKTANNWLTMDSASPGGSILGGMNWKGNLIGTGLDMIGGLIKPPPGYSGKKGNLQRGLDTAYDAVSNAAVMIPGVGSAVSLGMKALGVLNKGIQRIGGGTDGMTTTDAILNSNFLGWTPFGLLNGFAGKKANTYTRNSELDTRSNAGFGGFLSLQDITLVGAGKKYGLFSSGAREKLNKLTEYTLGVKHTISNIVDFNTLNNMAALGTTPYISQQQNIDLNGGIHMLRAASRGMKIKPIKLPKYNPIKYSKLVFDVSLGDNYVEADVDGKRTAVAKKSDYKYGQPVATKDGDIVYMKYDGTFTKNPTKSLYAEDGIKLAKKVILMYQSGNVLKRSVKVLDVATGKYVEIPIPLNKDLIQGRAPIRLMNNTVVFMNGDGSVTSDKWEIKGTREHLTPKGLEGLTINKTSESFKKGGKMNVIPEGALHARKNHLTDVDDIYKAVTHKGIPVITVENGEVIQHAEVEHSEIIFTKEVTDKIEAYRKEGTDEAAIACGKLLVKEILYNTDDRTGLIQTVE